MNQKNHLMPLFSFLLLAVLLAACAGKTTPAPTSPASGVTDPLKISSREAQAREFINLLAQGEFPQVVDQFDEKMKAALPLPKLEGIWADLNKQVGAYQEQLSAVSETRDGYEAVIVTTRFEKSNLDIRVVYDQSGRVAGLFFTPSKTSSLPWETPDYASLPSFDEKEVTVGIGEWALPGILTLPKGSGPFPAVVLVHGSGPNDRDETIGPNKPFKDLAWGLASQGIAVLRYDKRTYAHGGQMTPEIVNTFTVKEETIDDALLAVDLLRQAPEIDPQRIYVLGHSLGGTLIPRIGAADPKLAGLVVMAGVTRPLEEVMLDQYTYLFNLDGSISPEEQAQTDAIKQAIQKIQSPDLSASTPADQLLGIPANYWLDLRGFHPPEEALKLTQPLLILQGGRDYQVTLADYENWKQALEGHPQVTFQLYQDLNHLFISGQGPSKPEEYQQPGHVAEQVIQDLSAWILTPK